MHTNRFWSDPEGPGKLKLIVNMSAPESTSNINKELGTLKYVGIEDAREEVRRQGPGTLLVKVYIKSTYWVIPVHPEDRWLLGVMWDDKTCVCHSAFA